MNDEAPQRPEPRKEAVGSLTQLSDKINAGDIQDHRGTISQVQVETPTTADQGNAGESASVQKS